MKKTETSHKSKRSWWVLEFDVDSRQEDMASWLMMQLGANGCQFITGSSGKVTLQASFEADRISPEQLQPVYAALDEYGLQELGATLRINKLEEQDWLLEWKKGMQPLKLGERFLVSPPWFKDLIPEEDRKGRHIIWIEPGMAFGTGFHTTTQFCLRAVEKHLQQCSSSNSPRILDVGTGSGILSIAAAQLLKRAKITAVEIDPDACRVAAENFELNNVQDQITLLEGSIESCGQQTFDAILSNLTCEDNVALLPDYLRLLDKNGIVIMSGILLEKLAILENALAKFPLETVEKTSENIWAGLVVRRSSAD